MYLGASPLASLILLRGTIVELSQVNGTYLCLQTEATPKEGSKSETSS